MHKIHRSLPGGYDGIYGRDIDIDGLTGISHTTAKNASICYGNNIKQAWIK